MLETGLCWEEKREKKKKQRWERLSVREKEDSVKIFPANSGGGREEGLSISQGQTEAYGDPPRAQTERRTPRPRLTQGDLSPL